MAGLTTNFWGWDSPLIDKAVAFLSAGKQSAAALDLSRTLIITPTAESSRRLREALAAHAAGHETAVMAPWVWHPEQCLLSVEDRRRVAGKTPTLLAWLRVLQETDLPRLKHLLPVLPEITAAWQAGLANTLIELQAILGAGGLTFADVANAGAAAADRARWLELAELEQRFVRLLAEKNLAPMQQTKLERSHAPALPPGVERVVVIGVADPPPLFARWLRQTAERHEVVVCVQAPSALAARFDDIGQPLLEKWDENASLIVPVDEAQLHVAASSAMQAREATKMLHALLPVARTAVGACDAETALHLHDQLAAGDARAYEPGGEGAAQHGFLHFARQWQDLCVNGGWRAFASLLRVPEFARACCDRTDDAIRLLQVADDFADRRLPVTFESALALLEQDKTEHHLIRHAAQKVEGLLQCFATQPLPAAIRQLLLGTYGGQSFRPDQPHERDLMRLATGWIQIAEALERDGARIGAKLGMADVLALSIDLLAEEMLSDPRGDIDLVIQGWLELLWEPSPNLLVLGCNEENLPGIQIAHPFLPDSLRAALGLPCQATRFARDAYLLAALAAQREKSGALHLFCGQWNERGDALRPSRLLFLCDDAALPLRVNHLFPKDDSGADASQPPRTWAWKLRPRAVEARRADTISASRLRSYLACPFRYYLKNELRMEPVDAAKAELTPGEFGTLVHAAFRALTAAPAMRDCEDEKKIAAFLREAAASFAARQHGRQLPFPVRLQLDSAIQRLEAAAVIEAGRRQQGWRTLHGEFAIGGADDPHPLFIGRRRLTGSIDRIDQGPNGEILILDFKTGEKAVPPLEAHLQKLSAKKAAMAPEWQLHLDAEDKPRLWTDLQLPLYVHAWSLRQRGPVLAGYFQLPTSVQETAIAVWEDLDAAVLESAMQCATAAVARLDQRIHWPPGERVKYDDCGPLTGGRALEEIIDPVEMQQLPASTSA